MNELGNKPESQNMNAQGSEKLFEDYLRLHDMKYKPNFPVRK